MKRIHTKACHIRHSIGKIQFKGLKKRLFLLNAHHTSQNLVIVPSLNLTLRQTLQIPIHTNHGTHPYRNM